MTWNFDEAFIQTKIVADRVLPALLVGFVVRKVLHDELIDSIQRQSFLRTTTELVAGVGL